MKYRIIRISGIQFAKIPYELCKKYPQFQVASYHEKQKLVFQNFYVHFDSFSFWMSKLGHECHEILYDFKLLQQTWAKENGIFYHEKKVLFAQIQKIKPDILYFQDVLSMSLSEMKSLKKRFPFLKKIIIFRGFPSETKDLFAKFQLADLVLLGSPKLLSKCRKNNINVYLFPHFFDERVLEKIAFQPNHEFSFIGSSGYGYHFDHYPRYHLLKQLLEKTNIKVWVDEPTKPILISCLKQSIKNGLYQILPLIPNTILQNLKMIMPIKLRRMADTAIFCKRILGDKNIKIARVPLKDFFPKAIYPGLYGIDLFQVMKNSKVVLNKHSLHADGFVDNMRMFQVTGVGSCLLTDAGKNLNDLYDIDNEIITYNCLEECIEKSRHLLNHEKLRKTIAINGQKRTLKDHTAKKRFEMLNNLIKE